MTTAEFMIGRSADDAIERKQEVRKIVWALLAALLLHLVVGYGLALSNGLFSRPVPIEEEDKPIELTILDMATPPPTLEVKKNPMFMDTPKERESVEKPKEQTFQSNANSIGASETAASGALPIPSQDGTERPFLDLESQRESIAMDGAQPQPSVAPQPSATPSIAPSAQPTSTPLPNELAMLRATPSPSIAPSVRPTPFQRPASSYQPMKQKTKLSGAISNRGISSVNAVGTPLGRYQKMVNDAVGSRWYYYVRQRGDLVTIGTARLVFLVDRNGRVRNLKVVSNNSNEAFANVCLQSVMEIKLPPIPQDVAEVLPTEGLDAEMSFTMSAAGH